MASRHNGLPKPASFSLSKSELLRELSELDNHKSSLKRVLAMETEFRNRIKTHVDSLPTEATKLAKFNTNPFVLMFHCMKQGYQHIKQIEKDILPAKLFSSMETSAGRMVESVALPVYQWKTAPSEMHSPESVIDGKKQTGDVLCLATLKSGPRCLNDEMSSNIADDILANCTKWAAQAGVSKIEFTYGVLYGTRKLSNKKDWHILRNIKEKLKKASGGRMTVFPDNQWQCAFLLDGINVSVDIRIGIELWNYIAGQRLAFIELATALIRACVLPGNVQPQGQSFTIVDLAETISLDVVPSGYNVGIMQQSQLEWLFFFARHFCDELRP